MYFFYANSNTKYMIWWTIAVVVVVVIFTIPIKFKSKIFYDAPKNIGNIKFFLTNIVAFEENFSFELDTITFWTDKKVVKTKLLEFGKDKLIDRFFANAIKTLKLNTFKSDILVGHSYDYFYPTIIAGYIQCIENIIFAILSTKKKIKVFSNNVSATGSKTTLEIRFSCSISMSLWEIVCCFVKALVNNKEINYGKSSERNCR